MIAKGIIEVMHDAYIAYMEDKDTQRRRAFDALPESERAAITAEQEYIAGGWVDLVEEFLKEEIHQ